MNSSLSMGLGAPGAETSALQGTGGVHAGYGISLTDMSGFHEALTRAQAGGVSTLHAQPVSAPGEGMQA